MTEEPSSDHATEDIPPQGPLGAIRGLFVSVIEAARTRLDLAAIEAEIYLLRTIQLLLWSFAAVACGLLALAFAVVAVVAALHVYFLILEMFLWTKPLGLKTFRNSIEKATESAVLAANQGLYNGFLAAGLIWGLFHPNEAFAFQIKIFFLICVMTAGIYGAVTVSRRILFVQALPAAIALRLTKSAVARMPPRLSDG